MRIGHFVSFGVGGADKTSETLVKGLIELGHEVIVFYNDYSFPRSGHQYDNNTPKTNRFENYKNVKMVNIGINDISSLNEYGLDILNTHRSGNDFWHLVNFESTNFNFKVVETNFNGLTQTKADIRVYPSNTMIQNHNTPYVVIPNPVEPPNTSENFKEEFNLTDRFVYGRLSPSRKEIYNKTNLIAYKKIENESNFLLYVAPCEQAKIDAKNLGIRNIIFVDETIDNNTIHKLYNTFDVFCHSNSIGETFGMTVAEAMMFGKPVITHIGMSSWPQAQKELLGEKTELFVSDNIVERYSELMLKLKNNKDYYEETSKYLMNRANKNYHYIEVAKKYFELYKNIKNIS